MNLFNENVILYKEKTKIFSDKTENDNDIKITYEMVGSVDRTSDYDVTIYSDPPDEKIAEVNYVFNSAFMKALEKSPGFLFDANLYTHPMYFFLNSVPVSNDLLIRLNENMFFLNPANDSFFENEMVFTNVAHLPFFELVGFKKKKKDEETFFSESKSESKILSEIDISKTIGSWTLSNAVANYKNICTGTGSLSLSDQNCFPRDIINSLTLSKRKEYEQQAIEFIKGLRNPSYTEEKFKTNYIGPMRVALYYADESYHTFSAYFHVIHCIATVSQNKEAIRTLLLSGKQKLIKICRVSAAENFSFMMRYSELEIKVFKKKTAKYLARISHAIDFINRLEVNEIMGELEVKEIMGKLKDNTLGEYKKILAKYKNPTGDTKDKPIFDTVIDVDKIFGKPTVSEILQECYEEIKRVNNDITEILVIEPNKQTSP